MFEETIETYLKELNPKAYKRMMEKGTLEKIIKEINKRMESHFLTISCQLEKADPPDEDYIKSVGKLNNQRHKAIEMVRAMIEEEVRAW